MSTVIALAMELIKSCPNRTGKRSRILINNIDGFNRGVILTVQDSPMSTHYPLD